MINFTYILLGFLFLFLLIISYFLGRLQAKKPSESPLPGDLILLYNEVKELPAKVLATIQGSINPQKGKVAELLTYAELRYDYDRIIPLGQPVDFIGIKNGETVDFIEVKSGSSGLSFEEKAIRELIRNGKVNFRLIILTEQEIGGLVNKENKN